MFFASSDPRVLGYLGRSLSLELTGLQQNATVQRLLAAWGLAEESRRYKILADRGPVHVDRIITRMLALGVAPNASMLRPVRVGRSLRELLQESYAFEGEVIRLYSDAVMHTSHTGDHDNRVFFEKILEEKRATQMSLGSWLQELEPVQAPTMGRDRVTF